MARLMRECELRGVSRGKRRKGNQTEPERDSSQDLVRREFSAEQPNQLWFADITYVATHQGWLYLAVVFDIYSRVIVGVWIDSRR